MTGNTDRLIDTFVEVGALCYGEGVLPDALTELCVRLDIVAGDLLAEAMRLEWTPPASKGNPHPTPQPKPPTPPPPPPPGTK